MKMEWVLLAEGLGQDAKGAITAIGLNQSIFAASKLPASTKRAVVAHLVDDDDHLNAGDKITLQFSVTSPTDKVIAAQTVQATIGQRMWTDLPVAVDLPVELLLTFNEYGTHYLKVAVQIPDEEELKGQAELYVVEPLKSLAEVP